jgi:hypothetical protein
MNLSSLESASTRAIRWLTVAAWAVSLVAACASTSSEEQSSGVDAAARADAAAATGPDVGAIGDAAGASREDARRRCLALCESGSRSLRCRSQSSSDAGPNVVIGDNDDCFGRGCFLLWSEGGGLAITELNCDALTACTRSYGQGCGAECSAAQFDVDTSWNFAGARITCTGP